MVTLFEESPPPGPQAGGFWIRGLARLIDWLPVSAISFLGSIVVAFCSGLVIHFEHGTNDRLLDVLGNPSWFRFVISIVVTIAYHSICESVSGATVGKGICGLQVLSEDFGPASLDKTFKRSVAFLYDSLFFGAVGAGYMHNSPMKQRFGDEAAGTVVVKRSTLPESKQLSLGMFAAGLLAACVVAGFGYALLYGAEVLLRTLT